MRQSTLKDAPLAHGQSNTRITGLRVYDIRFPTSDHLDGSDAMNPDPDSSAA